MRPDYYSSLNDDRLSTEISWYRSILHGIEGTDLKGLLHSLETGNYTNDGLPQQVSSFQSHLRHLEAEAERRFLLQS